MQRFYGTRAAVAVLAVLAASMPVTAAPAKAESSPVWGQCPLPAPGEILDPRQECATLAVPMDYRRPHGRQITVAVSRIRAGDPALRHGILLLNPGGPGGSGLNLPSYLVRTLPADVTARFDLIGFDPRGVGHSTPITCGIPANVPPDLVLPFPAPDGSITRNVEFARATAAACAQHNGEPLPYITTANTARDMDRIRAALGERKTSYLGYSYGSYLGAVYTSLFTHRSDRVVLDSAVNPSRIWYDTWRLFGLGTTLRLPDFTTWAAKRHAVYGLGATPQEVNDYFYRTAAALDRNPIPLPDLLFNGNVLRGITRSLLYDDRLFPTLAEVWQAVGTPGGAAVAAAAASLQAPVDNQLAVLYSVACNDIAWSKDIQMYDRNTQLSRRLWPVTAGMPGNLWPCVFWHHRPIEPPVAVRDDGPRNVLVLQNLRDPATPWIGGAGMRAELGSRAALVTVDAGGHGIFGIRSGPCVDAIATEFLVTGVLPERDRFCAGPSPEDVDPTDAAAPVRVPSWPLSW